MVDELRPTSTREEADPDKVGVAAQVDVQGQLLKARDNRRQRWILYGFLLLASAAYLTALLWLVLCAWATKTEPEVIAFAKMSPGATALVGAIIASMVAIPLSLCVALGKLVSDSKDEKPTDSTTFTSAFFELGKAFAQGVKSLKG